MSDNPQKKALEAVKSAGFNAGEGIISVDPEGYVQLDPIENPIAAGSYKPDNVDPEKLQAQMEQYMQAYGSPMIHKESLQAAVNDIPQTAKSQDKDIAGDISQKIVERAAHDPSMSGGRGF